MQCKEDINRHPARESCANLAVVREFEQDRNASKENMPCLIGSLQYRHMLLCSTNGILGLGFRVCDELFVATYKAVYVAAANTKLAPVRSLEC